VVRGTGRNGAATAVILPHSLQHVDSGCCEECGTILTTHLRSVQQRLPKGSFHRAPTRLVRSVQRLPKGMACFVQHLLGSYVAGCIIHNKNPAHATNFGSSQVSPTRETCTQAKRGLIQSIDLITGLRKIPGYYFCLSWSGHLLQPGGQKTTNDRGHQALFEMEEYPHKSTFRP
jgi:hypothetical protein